MDTHAGATTTNDHHHQHNDGCETDLTSSECLPSSKKDTDHHHLHHPQHDKRREMKSSSTEPAYECKRNHSQFHQNPAMLVESELSLTATDYKNAGNRLCTLYRHEDAISYYDKAIAKDPNVSIFYSNKALCHLKLQQWPQAIQDCRKALELDPNSIKANFFLGQTLAESGCYDEALKHLQRAHELAKEKQLNFGDDITYQIRLTKRRRWSKIEDETAQLENELHEYLVNLIKQDTSSKLKELNERLQTIGSVGSSTQQIDTIGFTREDAACASNEEANLESAKARVQSKCDIYAEKLETMFSNLKLQRRKRDVPDYLCGKISFEIMRDPVITPSGITYDRQDIEEHLRRVGHFDPINRQPLRANQLVTNLAMKEVVDAYLSENEWANYY